MKLHEMQPAEGSRKPRTRVGRGIAAGKGKTAGRGTKGQKARTGGTIQPWFEGGQTPLQIRIPKLRGFRNPFKTEYEVVNVGELSILAEFGALESGDMPGGGGRTSAGQAPVTITQDILRAVGLVRTLDRPLKILGGGEVTQRLFVIADAFSKSAVAKIEAAGGTAQVIELPSGQLEALGVTPSSAEAGAEPAPATRETSDRDVNETAAEALAEPTGTAEDAEPSGPETL